MHDIRYDSDDPETRMKPSEAEQQSRTSYRERLALGAGLVLQLFILGGMMFGGALPFLTGETILLRVIPVDPRDLFRGEYVALGYDIGRVPPEGIAGLPSPMRPSEPSYQVGRTVYVRLIPEADGRHYRGNGASVDPPAPGEKFIAGTLAIPGRITFGIESYYVQEGKAKAYEAAIRDHRLSAEVSLTPSGRAGLRGLIVE